MASKKPRLKNDTQIDILHEQILIMARSPELFAQCLQQHPPEFFTDYLRDLISIGDSFQQAITFGVPLPIDSTHLVLEAIIQFNDWAANYLTKRSSINQKILEIFFHLYQGKEHFGLIHNFVKYGAKPSERQLGMLHSQYNEAERIIRPIGEIFDVLYPKVYRLKENPPADHKGAIFVNVLNRNCWRGWRDIKKIILEKQETDFKNYQHLEFDWPEMIDLLVKAGYVEEK